MMKRSMRERFFVAVCLDRKSDVLIQGVYLGYMPPRRILRDEGCRNLIENILDAKLGIRPVLVRFREACKLYALAWLLADLVPEDPTWARVVTRFAKRSARAATLWEHTTTGVDCADTAGLFRALVFGERCRSVSSHRVVIDDPDFDVLKRAIALAARCAHARYRRQLRKPRRHKSFGSLAQSALSHANPLSQRDQWAGVLCAKLSVVLLVPVNRLRRPLPGCRVIVTNMRDLRVANQRQFPGAHGAQALERLAKQIQAADPYASGHSILAMQGPLIVAAEELRARLRQA
jgi:hypothetical protein